MTSNLGTQAGAARRPHGLRREGRRRSSFQQIEEEILGELQARLQPGVHQPHRRSDRLQPAGRGRAAARSSTSCSTTSTSRSRERGLRVEVYGRGQGVAARTRRGSSPRPGRGRCAGPSSATSRTRSRRSSSASTGESIERIDVELAENGELALPVRMSRRPPRSSLPSIDVPKASAIPGAGTSRRRSAPPGVRTDEMKRELTTDRRNRRPPFHARLLAMVLLPLMLSGGMPVGAQIPLQSATQPGGSGAERDRPHDRVDRVPRPAAAVRGDPALLPRPRAGQRPRRGGAQPQHAGSSGSATWSTTSRSRPCPAGDGVQPGDHRQGAPGAALDRLRGPEADLEDRHPGQALDPAHPRPRGRAAEPGRAPAASRR